MRFVRFQKGRCAPSHGILEPDSRIARVEGEIFGEWKRGEYCADLDGVTLLAPVQPPNIVAIARNYRSHIAETGKPMPAAPLLFLKATTAIIGPEQPIVLPAIAPNEVDYEAELVIVIGKLARNVSEEDALDYVLGYTCGNDISARDVQLRLDAQWARGKSFDTFAPLGPWIETELDPDGCAIRCRLNGELMQEGNTRGDLLFTCGQLVSYLSRSMTMLPGTVIMTGTPSGVGFKREPPVFLKSGDIIEVEIEGIGTLRNPVVGEG